MEIDRKMSDLERINYSINLEENHERLEASLAHIDEQIRVNQDECSHKGVCITSKSEINCESLGTIIVRKKITKCLLCNKILNDNEYSDLVRRGLAISCLTDESSIIQMEQFKKIQMVFKELSKKYVGKSEEEIFEIFKSFMDTDVNIESLETGRQYYK